jgi:sulfite dehydrogenase (quinone) subunit SoeC
MHPSASVIIFTSLSGLGFGLMFYLGFGMLDVWGWSAFWYYFVAYGLAVGGLISSTMHLGNPQRAMNAFSQWRSSWLSREGVAAVATLLLTAPYAIGVIFLDTSWPLLGWISGILALVTIYTTSKIYNQLKTVPRWHMPLTPVLFLLYALAGGALLASQILVAIMLLLVLTLLQIAAWQMGDKAFANAGHTLETATGLGHLGKMRLLESPHSSPNYLMREMVHVVGRKHSLKLRAISAITLGLFPVAILLLLPLNQTLVIVAIASHVIGLFASRWLFFAEAEHVVGLYYDKR